MSEIYLGELRESRANLYFIAPYIAMHKTLEHININLSRGPL